MIVDTVIEIHWKRLRADLRGKRGENTPYHFKDDAMKLYIDFGLRAFDTQALHVRVSVMTCFLLSAHFCSYHSWFFAAIVVYSKQRNTNFHFG